MWGGSPGGPPNLGSLSSLVFPWLSSPFSLSPPPPHHPLTPLCSRMRPIWGIWHLVGFSYPFICFFTTTYLFSHQVGFLLNNIVQTVNILGHSGHFRSFSCPIQKSAQMGILPYFTTFSVKIMFGWCMVIVV